MRDRREIVRRLHLFPVLRLALSAPAFAGEWPQWRGPAHDAPLGRDGPAESMSGLRLLVEATPARYRERDHLLVCDIKEEPS